MTNEKNSSARSWADFTSELVHHPGLLLRPLAFLFVLALLCLLLLWLGTLALPQFFGQDVVGLTPKLQEKIAEAIEESGRLKQASKTAAGEVESAVNAAKTAKGEIERLRQELEQQKARIPDLEKISEALDSANGELAAFATRLAGDQEFLSNVQADLFPIGAIVPFAGGEKRKDGKDNLPKGWLPCDGREVSRIQYKKLLEGIEDSWGGGDGTSTFNLPDLRGFFLRGATDNRARDPDHASRFKDPELSDPDGTGVGSYQGHMFGRHNHFPEVRDRIGSDTGGTTSDGAEYAASARVDSKRPTTHAGGSETRPKNAYVLFIIKAE